MRSLAQSFARLFRVARADFQPVRPLRFNLVAAHRPRGPSARPMPASLPFAEGRSRSQGRVVKAVCAHHLTSISLSGHPPPRTLHSTTLASRSFSCVVENGGTWHSWWKGMRAEGEMQKMTSKTTASTTISVANRGGSASRMEIVSITSEH